MPIYARAWNEAIETVQSSYLLHHCAQALALEGSLQEPEPKANYMYSPDTRIVKFAASKFPCVPQ